MKLSEYQNEDALDLLADLLDPITNIFSDKEFEKTYKKGNKMKVIQYLLKNKARQKDVIAILARLDNVPVKEYKLNVFTLPTKLIELMNDEDLMDFFASQGFGMGGESSGSATESTEAIETK